MDKPATAEEALPLLAGLPQKERVRLIQLIVEQARGNDAAAYVAMPVQPNEFWCDESALAWDAEGWE